MARARSFAASAGAVLVFPLLQQHLWAVAAAQLTQLGGGLRGTAVAGDGAPALHELLLSFAEFPSGGVPLKRLQEIERSIAPTFAALPKNDDGRLTQRGARHLVHHYFAKEHGWLIIGLEPHGMRDDASRLHEIAILQAQVPELVEDLVRQGYMDLGFALRDVTAMAALVERLLTRDAGRVLSRAYDFNGHAPGASLDEAALLEVVSSCLLLFHRNNDEITAEEHQLFKMLTRQEGEAYFSSLEDFARDAVLSYIHIRLASSNPFRPQRFGSDAALDILDGLLHRFGKWQNEDRRLMKEDLISLDPYGTGLVPLARFHAHWSPRGFVFRESLEYLRQIGAAEEAAGGRPQVRIANYLLGPSNCMPSSSAHLSLCGISECEALMSEIEVGVRAPSADAETLLSIASNLSSSSVDAPRELPEALAVRLADIAARSASGEVPLHGRLFAEWLHAAFPLECPFPYIAEDAVALTAGHFDHERHVLSEDETEPATNAAGDGPGAAAGEDAASTLLARKWSEEEVLLLLVERTPRTTAAAVADALRLTILAALFAVVLSAAWRLAAAAAAAMRSRPAIAGGGKPRGARSELPL